MTPRTKARPKARAQKAKARVMWATSRGLEIFDTLIAQAKQYGPDLDVSLAVLPLPLPAARKLRDFANLSEEERVEACAKALHLGINFGWGDIREAGRNQYRQQARAVLSAIGL